MFLRTATGHLPILGDGYRVVHSRRLNVDLQYRSVYPAMVGNHPISRIESSVGKSVDDKKRLNREAFFD